MTPDELGQRGRALFGDRWQTELARALNVSDRTVRRWLAGTLEMPRETEHKLEGLLEDKVIEIGALMVRFRSRAAGTGV